MDILGTLIIVVVLLSISSFGGGQTAKIKLKK